MNPIGMHYGFWSHNWDEIAYIPLMEKLAWLGFDICEVASAEWGYYDDARLRELKACADHNGLGITYSIGLEAKYDLASDDPAVRENGIRHVTRILESMPKVGATILNGVSYAGWQALPDHGITLDEKRRKEELALESMSRLMKVAENCGVLYCCEVVNRFEQYLLNTAKEGVEFVKRLGSPNARVLLDTFHMNIEEDSMVDAILEAGPYAHDNRTYVPVRFAAQAFGCAVGWDAGDRTVILIDMEKLVEETLSKYDFTYLEKYLAYGQKYRTGIWDLNADFDASLDMTGLLLGSTAESAPITLDGTLEGVMAGGAKMDAAMGLTMDLRPFLKALTDGQNGGMSASDTELLDALAEEGIHMELRGDLEAGQLYISLGGAFLEQAAGLPADTWYSMDMSAIYEDMGLDYGALMEMTTGDVDYTALLSLLLSTVEPNDKDTAYSELTQAVDLAAQLLRDDAWAVSGNDRILHYALEQDGVAADFTFTLTMRGDDVSAYDLSVELSADVDGSAPMSIFLQESMDADGRMEASMQCDAAGLMDLEFSMSGRYTEGKTAPETEPPKGAVVVDLTAPEAPADPVPTSGDPAEVVIDKIYTTGGGFIGVTEG